MTKAVHLKDQKDKFRIHNLRSEGTSLQLIVRSYQLSVPIILHIIRLKRLCQNLNTRISPKAKSGQGRVMCY